MDALRPTLMRWLTAEADLAEQARELDRLRIELADTQRMRDFHQRSASHIARKRDRAEQLIGHWRNGDIDAETVLDRIARALSAEGDDAPPPPTADSCGCQTYTHPGHYPNCPARTPTS